MSEMWSSLSKQMYHVSEMFQTSFLDSVTSISSCYHYMAALSTSISWFKNVFYLLIYTTVPHTTLVLRKLFNCIRKFYTSRIYAIKSITHLHLLTPQGAELLLRNCKMCSYSRTSHHFMEPEGSLPCSQ
jgi:hypothetical protein